MRVYRALLHFYPSSFRAEYGREMTAGFAKRFRDADGTLARLTLLAGAAVDTLFNATLVHGSVLAQDLRYTVRSLVAARGFALTAIVVSALGIGATTAAFSLADHVLVRPLPYPDADRLMKIWHDKTSRGYPRLEPSPANYIDWKAASVQFDVMAAHQGFTAAVLSDGEPARLEGTQTEPDLFRVLGVPAALGRTLIGVDADPASPRAIVLSDGLWRSLFAADSSVLGRTMLLNDTPYTVVGVMPAHFMYPGRATRYWIPLRFTQKDRVDRANYYLNVIGRVKPGVTMEQARAEMRSIAARLEQDYPDANKDTSATVYALRDELSAQSRLLLYALVGASVCLLLIACTNLAGLLLTRALSRQRELAVRAALGAGWNRLARQMFTESFVLALVGGVLGVVLAIALQPLMVRLVPNALPVGETPPLDLRLLVWAVGFTVATALGFGTVPAMRTTRSAAASGLREGAREGSSRRTERIRTTLVIAEVTVSVVLLVSAGLLIRALWQVQSIDPGFKAEGVLTARTWLQSQKYRTAEQRSQFYAQVIGGVEALPGVTSAAYTSFLPFVMRGGLWPVTIGGQGREFAAEQTASVRFVTPGYFLTLQIPLLQGRYFLDSDTAGAAPVAVISESFVRMHWPGQDAIGRVFSIGDSQRTVVGVVGNVRFRGLERDNNEPQVYMPHRQVPDGQMFYAPKDLVVATTSSPAALAPAVRDIIRRADPQLPITDVRSLTDVVDLETAPRTAQVRVLGGFAILALLLAGVGIHGLLAFAVSSRAREIGVRIALGAGTRNILETIVGRGLACALAGVAIGAALAFAAGRSLQALLAGISAADGTTFGLAIALCFAMTLAGSLFPALRALRIDPIRAIRIE
jgi:putative ABC transport system permease protein